MTTVALIFLLFLYLMIYPIEACVKIYPLLLILWWKILKCSLSLLPQRIPLFLFILESSPVNITDDSSEEEIFVKPVEFIFHVFLSYL